MAATPATSITLISSGLADGRQQSTIGNPNVSQFIKVIQKTTRWSAQWNRINFDGDIEFGTKVSMTLPRIAELITGYTVVVTMPDIYTTQLNAIKAAGGSSLTDKGDFLGPIYGWTNSLGHALIQQIDLEIGGVIVESFDSRLLEILDEFYEPIDNINVKNSMIKRLPSGFSSSSLLAPPSRPTTVYIPIPFWFSKPGIYSHALPIAAINTDIVRVHITFRPIEQLFYTTAMVDIKTVGFRNGVDIPGNMWGLQGGRFWKSDNFVSTRVYSMDSTTPVTGVTGTLIDGISLPLRLSPIEAYALVEYISLEERESIAMRISELTYKVPQHIAVPVQYTHGSKEVYIPLPYNNPVKEIFWCCQRPEAETYNAWFLFTRDLSPINSTVLPWWPDADLTRSVTNKWSIKPGFSSAYSEPIQSAVLLYNTIDRVISDGGSFYRCLVPSQVYTKNALINRYIYAYSFELYANGNIPMGAANWDKIPKKELNITMADGRRGRTPPPMNIYVYITVWNIFKVFGGRAGMLFTS
jgi:hypothetical protein